MKKTLLAVLIVASVVSIAALSWSTAEVDAMGCYRCLPGDTTPGAWGMGNTCNEARSNAIANAMALIPGSCDTCSTTPILVKDCYSSNPIKADYKVRYKCNQDLCM